MILTAGATYSTYYRNRVSGHTHEDIVAAVERYCAGRGVSVAPGTWDQVERWYQSSRITQEREDVVRAYRAMMYLRYQKPVRIQSRVGLVRLLEAVFAGYPPTGRTVAMKREPSPVKVRWSWPAEVCARAHRARPLIGAV